MRNLVARLATSADAGDVAWLAALTFPLACPRGTSVESMAAHIAQHLRPVDVSRWIVSDEHILLVADDGEGITGYALLVLGTPQGPDERAALAAVGPGPYTELSKIYVHPSRQGDGTADVLMRGAMAQVEQSAPRTTRWLGTNGQNARAQAFYRKHGFEVVGERSYVVGGVRHEDVVMVHTADR